MGWNQNIYVSNSVYTSFFSKITYPLIGSFPPHLIPVTWVSNTGPDKSYYLLFCLQNYICETWCLQLQGKRKEEDGFEIIAATFVPDSFNKFLLSTFVRVTGDKW